MRNHPIRFLIIVLVLGAAALAGYRALRREKPLQVQVHTVAMGQVLATVANTRAGTVKAGRRASLAPATGGQIASLAVTEGDRVEPDQILLSLWNRDLTAELALAEQEAVGAVSMAQESCLIADDAEREARRLAGLKKKNLVSPSAYDQAVTTAQARQAGCKAARTRTAVAEARIETVRARLERTILRAPFAGVVAEVNGEIGEFITPSPTGVATLPAVDLINSDSLYVSAPIDEIDAAAIRVGMEARISLDAFPDRVFKGRVKRIAPYVLEMAKQARTVEVETLFVDQDQPANLLPGYSADVEIVLDAREGVLRVPSECLLRDGEVFLLSADGLIRKQKIRPGLANWRFTEVLEGLKPGDQVVTTIDREGLVDGVLAEIEPGNAP